MASGVSFYFLLILLVILTLFTSNAFSTSRLALDRAKVKKNGFRVMLEHVDSRKNITKLERIQHGIIRARNRLKRFNAMALVADSNLEVSTPVLAGDGEYLMKIAIGTPAETYSAIMDTGSDLIWTQCKPCRQCFDQPTPIFDPRKSSSFSKVSCYSQLCEDLHRSTCRDGCQYLYSYGDHSWTQGVLASETFTIGEVSVHNVAFGCGEDNEGQFTEGAGIVGLARGPLSLVSQLKEPKFSYCLTSMDDTKSSTLLMGSLANVNSSGANSMKTTPLIRNPLQPTFYYLSLEGISVGGTLLPIKKSTFALQDDGTGGLIIDSGTTITYLEESAFDVVKREFASQMELPLDNSGAMGLDLCFSLPSYSSRIKVPTFVLHFQGADLEFPVENYMIADSDIEVICLAMGGSSGKSILGNIQQQNMLVVHDLEKETLSFLPTQCNQLISS